jgi:hypothetical protein
VQDVLIPLAGDFVVVVAQNPAFPGQGIIKQAVKTSCHSPLP